MGAGTPSYGCSRPIPLFLTEVSLCSARLHGSLSSLLGETSQGKFRPIAQQLLVVGTGTRLWAAEAITIRMRDTHHAL